MDWHTGLGIVVALLLAAAYLVLVPSRLNERAGLAMSAALVVVALVAARLVPGAGGFGWFAAGVGFGQLARWLALRQPARGPVRADDAGAPSTSSSPAGPTT